jgi:hypothetical protein
VRLNPDGAKIIPECVEGNNAFWKERQLRPDRSRRKVIAVDQEWWYRMRLNIDGLLEHHSIPTACNRTILEHITDYLMM